MQNGPFTAADFPTPSFTGARYFAVTRMREAGRTKPDDSDKAELARLLFHVEYEDGGFLGASDEQREERAAQLHLPIKIVEGASWATGVWPAQEFGSDAESPACPSGRKQDGFCGTSHGDFADSKHALTRESAKVADAASDTANADVTSRERPAPHYLDPWALFCASNLTDRQISDPARMASASANERVAMQEEMKRRKLA